MMRFIETLYADPLLKFLVGTTMKSFMIFAIASVFAFCLRRRSAAMRGFIWSMAIVGCLIIPLLSLVLPKWELGILPAEAPVSNCSEPIVAKACIVNTNYTNTVSTQFCDRSERDSLYHTALV